MRMESIRLSDLQNNRRETTFDLLGREIPFAYRPLKLTFDEQSVFEKRWEQEAENLRRVKAGELKAAELETDEDSLFEYLEALLDEWPFTDDTDQPLPIRPEVMHTMNPLITLGLFVAIGDDSRPNPKKRSDSAAPS